MLPWEQQGRVKALKYGLVGLAALVVVYHYSGGLSKSGFSAFSFHDAIARFRGKKRGFTVTPDVSSQAQGKNP